MRERERERAERERERWRGGETCVFFTLLSEVNGTFKPPFLAPIVASSTRFRFLNAKLNFQTKK